MLEALESDFQMAKLGPMFARAMVPGGAASVAEFMDEARTRLMEECNYSVEAQRQREFGQLYRHSETVTIPEVHDEWCGQRVLVTSWEPGLSFEQFLASQPSQETRDKVGAALFDFYFGTLYRNGLFHADPHPGNYALREGGRLVIYDFGCTRRFDQQTVLALSNLGHAVAQDKEDAIRKAFAELGGQIPRDWDSYERVRAMLRSFFSPMLSKGRCPVDASVNVAMGQVMKDKMLLMRLKIPGKLLFLFRIRFGLYAVLARLGAQCDWSSMEQQFYAQHTNSN